MMDYDEWSKKYRNDIALCIGAMYGIILIILAVLVTICVE